MHGCGKRTGPIYVQFAKSPVSWVNYKFLVPRFQRYRVNFFCIRRLLHHVRNLCLWLRDTWRKACPSWKWKIGSVSFRWKAFRPSGSMPVGVPGEESLAGPEGRKRRRPLSSPRRSDVRYESRTTLDHEPEWDRYADAKHPNLVKRDWLIRRYEARVTGNSAFSRATHYFR